jgi:DNA-binding MarR family transcriptional regulator
MITNQERLRAQRLRELRDDLRRVMRGLWARRRPTGELFALVHGVGLLAHVGTNGPQTVSELAQALGLSLPAASKLTRELEAHRLVARREDPADRRRTVVALDETTAAAVRGWLDERNRPLERALATLDPDEQAAFLKGVRALADALMEESSCGPLRSHHREAHRRRTHRHRPV